LGSLQWLSHALRGAFQFGSNFASDLAAQFSGAVTSGIRRRFDV
jgi:hypothetical protein